jgi:hypothetical protein
LKGVSVRGTNRTIICLEGDGVWIRYDSLVRITALFYHNCPSLIERKVDSVKSSFLYLYVHELFHHAVENSASIIEIISGKSQVFN